MKKNTSIIHYNYEKTLGHITFINKFTFQKHIGKILQNSYIRDLQTYKIFEKVTDWILNVESTQSNCGVLILPRRI